MSETPDFQSIENSNEIKNIPFFEVMRWYKEELMSGFAISSCAYMFLYITTIYIASLYTDLYKISNSLSLLLSTLIMVIWMVVTPLGGALADKIGLSRYLKNMLILSCLVICVLYYINFNYKSFNSLLLLQVGLSIIGALIFAPVPGLLKQAFPTKIRFSGVSISNTTAQSILGGPSPFYAALLISLTGLEYAPMFILLFACFFGYLGIKGFDRKNLQAPLACPQNS